MDQFWRGQSKVDTAPSLNLNRAAHIGLTRSGIGVGRSTPLGATVQPGGVNFSIYSKNGTLVELLLFDSADSFEASRIISLDPREHRTYHYWHVFVPDVMPGQVYGFRVLGPFDPRRGLRFDRDSVLLDPYGRAVAIPKTRTIRKYVRRIATSLLEDTPILALAIRTLGGAGTAAG